MNASIIGETLLAQLQQCSDLPTPPTVATKIIELSTHKSADLDTLASIVAMDPALSAKILSIANSSMKATKCLILKKSMEMRQTQLNYKV